jgi:hypothetical protein
MVFFAAIFAVNRTIHTFSLIHNPIKIYLIYKFCESLKSNTALNILNLEGNFYGETNAIHIADMLKINTTIHTISIASNNIGSNGVHYIAEALKMNTTIHTIDLSMNEIEPKGASSIKELIHINTTIRNLGLSKNKFGTNGGFYIAEGLGDNLNICVIDFGWTPDDQMIDKISSNGGISRKNYEWRISSGWCDITDTRIREINEYLERNRHICGLEV